MKLRLDLNNTLDQVGLRFHLDGALPVGRYLIGCVRIGEDHFLGLTLLAGGVAQHQDSKLKVEVEVGFGHQMVLTKTVIKRWGLQFLSVSTSSVFVLCN